MTAFLALLRGVNVGGRTLVSMATLRREASALKLEDVRTHLQSGNLLFHAPARRSSRLPAELEGALAETAGVDVRVILRTKDGLAKAVAGNPMMPSDLPGNKLHVVFLAGAPSPGLIQKLDPNRSPPDEFVVRGQHIYVSYPNGSGRSKLNLDYFERTLATPATARNWNTVTKLLDLMA
jgi:uncharacterized protein (DUF1697 family)